MQFGPFFYLHFWQLWGLLADFPRVNNIYAYTVQLFSQVLLFWFTMCNSSLRIHTSPSSLFLLVFPTGRPWFFSGLVGFQDFQFIHFIHSFFIRTAISISAYSRGCTYYGVYCHHDFAQSGSCLPWPIFYLNCSSLVSRKMLLPWWAVYYKKT